MNYQAYINRFVLVKYMEENNQTSIEKDPGNPELLNLHKAKIQDNNGSSRIHIPSEICDKLNIEPGDIAEIRANKGKHGKYVEFWIPKKQGDQQ
jgi:hypothetical protein